MVFNNLLQEAYNATGEAEVQLVMLRIMNEAIQHGLSFDQKIQVHILILNLSSKYSNFEKSSSHLLQIIMQSKVITGKFITRECIW